MSIGTEGAAVLLVEDDALLRRAIGRALQEVHAQVTAVGTGLEALEAIGPGPECGFSAVILDIGLPDADGRDVCAAVRARGITTPVLFLTARGQVDDRLSGFTAGGDDYLPKPFDTRELLVRTGALVRRAGSTPPREVTGVRLDPVNLRLLAAPGGQDQTLTPTEYRVLAPLMNAPGEALRRRALAVAGWSAGAMVTDNVLDQYISRIRRKVEAASAGTSAIHTVHGVGYRFE